MANPQVDPRKIRSLIRASGCEDGPWRDGSEECGDHDSLRSHLGHSQGRQWSAGALDPVVEVGILGTGSLAVRGSLFVSLLCGFLEADQRLIVMGLDYLTIFFYYFAGFNKSLKDPGYCSNRWLVETFLNHLFNLFYIIYKINDFYESSIDHGFFWLEILPE